MRNAMKWIVPLMVLCSSLHAADGFSQWFAHGRFIQESSSQKMTNGYGAKLDFTTESDFLNNWRTHWKSVSKIKHNAGIYIVVFFVNVNQIPHTDNDFTFDITIRKPDGSTYASMTNMRAPRYRGPATGPMTDSRRLDLAPNFVTVQIQPKDPAGAYLVEAMVKDNLNRVSFRLEKQLTVER
jgi:hypothetical protein